MINPIHWSFCPSSYHFLSEELKEIVVAAAAFFSLSGIRSSLILCLSYCSRYFSATATQEILDELRPQMCPFASSFSHAIQMFKLFLPVNLPPNLHDQGFKFVGFSFFSSFSFIYFSLQVMVT
jgi:hypothetical protein